MTRGCQERAVRLVRPFRFLARRDDLLLHLLALRDVADHAGHERAAGCCDRAEADLDREFGSVLAQRNQVEAGTHRSQRGSALERQPVFAMLAADPLRQQLFNWPPQQLVPLVAEHTLCLAVDDGDLAILVDDDHRIRRRFQQRPEIGL